MTITSASGLRHLRGTDGDRNQGAHGDGYSNGDNTAGETSGQPGVFAVGQRETPGQETSTWHQRQDPSEDGRRPRIDREKISELGQCREWQVDRHYVHMFEAAYQQVTHSYS